MARTKPATPFYTCSNGHILLGGPKDAYQDLNMNADLLNPLLRPYSGMGSELLIASVIAEIMQNVCDATVRQFASMDPQGGLGLSAFVDPVNGLWAGSKTRRHFEQDVSTGMYRVSIMRERSGLGWSQTGQTKGQAKSQAKTQAKGQNKAEIKANAGDMFGFEVVVNPRDSVVTIVQIGTRLPNADSLLMLGQSDKQVASDLPVDDAKHAREFSAAAHRGDSGNRIFWHMTDDSIPGILAGVERLEVIRDRGTDITDGSEVKTDKVVVDDAIKNSKLQAGGFGVGLKQLMLLAIAFHFDLKIAGTCELKAGHSSWSLLQPYCESSSSGRKVNKRVQVKGSLVNSCSDFLTKGDMEALSPATRALVLEGKSDILIHRLDLFTPNAILEHFQPGNFCVYCLVFMFMWLMCLH